VRLADNGKKQTPALLHFRTSPHLRPASLQVENRVSDILVLDKPGTNVANYCYWACGLDAQIDHSSFPGN